ncbi:hypothetical protein [Geodermatophilus amargosae]|uniref:hypothetical protein n=1 Tax=Geodermatophilus amargosae TaxID=1296565 RepID=UPI0034DEA59E
MAGRTPRRRAPLGTRLAVVTGIALSVVLVTPGAASAHYGWIQPEVTCVTPVQNGSWTAVFGYRNTTSATLTVGRGSLNDMTPDRFDGTQVTRFSPGTRQGAFSVQVPASITTVQWQVYGEYGIARRDSGTRCPSSTELPADGNGMGVVIALAAAGAVGGTSVYVSRRRRDRGTPVPTAD